LAAETGLPGDRILDRPEFPGGCDFWEGWDP